MKTVKFIASYGVYVPGMVAGFPTELADRLIAAKIAVPEAVAKAAVTQRARDVASKVLRKGKRS